MYPLWPPFPPIINPPPIIKKYFQGGEGEGETRHGFKSLALITQTISADAAKALNIAPTELTRRHSVRAQANIATDRRTQRGLAGNPPTSRRELMLSRPSMFETVVKVSRSRPPMLSSMPSMFKTVVGFWSSRTSRNKDCGGMSKAHFRRGQLPTERHPTDGEPNKPSLPLTSGSACANFEH